MVLVQEQTDQQIRFEKPEIDLNKYGNLIYDRYGTPYQWWKGSNKWC